MERRAVDPAPPFMSPLIGALGIAAIVVIQVAWMGLLLTNSPAGWESPFWDSFTPVLVMAGVAVVVGVFCYADFCDQPVGNRDRRVFRPFYWCLGLVVAAVPLMYAAGMAAFVLYFEF